ncbi:hypothetical protein HMPREF1487_07390 [Pseudomonas sp. HPB0071]|nr:hypothetical protein HMPREF1487_07390 [Pseudomonas sp. HPB0071]
MTGIAALPPPTSKPVFSRVGWSNAVPIITLKGVYQ